MDTPSDTASATRASFFMGRLRSIVCFPLRMSRRRLLKGLSRRVFVHRLAFMGGGVILLGGACTEEKKPSPKKQPVPEPLTTSHHTFTNDQFAVLMAAVDRILPRDEDPGALDANVHEYIDSALQVQQLKIGRAHV